MARYLGRLSGPLLDRLDLHVGLRPLRWSELERTSEGASSAAVSGRVAQARERQARRGAGRFRTNSQLPDDAIDELVDATAEARALLGRAVERLALSARAARRVLRVARTIADLAGEGRTAAPAVAEALGYRDPHPGGEGP